MVLKSRYASASAALAAAFVLMLAGCGEESTGPTIGNLKVSASTAGSDLDPDGYTVTVDGSDARTIGLNGSVNYSGVPAGSHSVALADLSQNCDVDGDNPRTLKVSDGGTASVAFDVTCAPMVGDVSLSTATTGADLDPDGYTVKLDGDSVATVGLNESRALSEVHAGGHEVQLTGVAANCTVAGGNSQSVTVTYQGTVDAAFDVTCSAATGDLQVDASTSGSDVDPDGYTATVDGGSSQSLPVNGSVTFAGLAEGDHSVQLSGVAANCTVADGNPRTVSVPFDATATTTFDVVCSTNVGSVQITTSTTGADLDPDGYTIVLDNTLSQSVGINASVTFNNVAVGTHSVQLSGNTSNCTVTSANPQSVDVTYNATATATFEVSCDATTGDLSVTTVTTGSSLPAGYQVAVDGGATQNIGANETITFNDVGAGDHSVELTGIAENCTLTGENPRTVTVSGGAGSTTFELSCFTPLSGKIAFESDRSGNYDIWVMDTNGANAVPLTTNSADDRQPAVSPDGLKIAFARTRVGGGDIWVMNADGSGQVQLTSNGNNFTPAWSPDGSRIAFSRVVGGNFDVWVMNADGSGLVNLTNDAADDRQPTWSPDGSQIAFQTNRDGNFEIYVMNQDGSSPTNLTNDPGFDDTAPVWSPLGDKISFHSNRTGNGDIFVMDANGLNQTQLTTNPASDYESAWSPDAAKLVFTSERDGNPELYVIDVSTPFETRLTNNPAKDSQGFFSP